MGYLARAFEYYKGLPHQREAVAKLEGMISPETIEAFRKVFSPSQQKLILQVPYFSQLDNLRMPHRTCNPSSCAMCLDYLLPDTIAADDDLIDDMMSRGYEVTNHQQMTLSLRGFGLESVFRYDMSRQNLENELKEGRPVVMGILHQGPVSSPWGGGHMIVAVGLDPRRNALICHDPNGSLLSGYRGPAKEGRFVTYPWSEIGPRWLVEGPESGWGRIFLTNREEPLNGHLRAA